MLSFGFSCELSVKSESSAVIFSDAETALTYTIARLISIIRRMHASTCLRETLYRGFYNELTVKIFFKFTSSGEIDE